MSGEMGKPIRRGRMENRLLNGKKNVSANKENTLQIEEILNAKGIETILRCKDVKCGVKCPDISW